MTNLLVRRRNELMPWFDEMFGDFWNRAGLPAMPQGLRRGVRTLRRNRCDEMSQPVISPPVLSQSRALLICINGWPDRLSHIPGQLGPYPLGVSRSGRTCR